MFLPKLPCGFHEIALRLFHVSIVGRYHNLNFIQYGICITCVLGGKMFIKGLSEILRRAQSVTLWVVHCIMTQDSEVRSWTSQSPSLSASQFYHL